MLGTNVIRCGVTHARDEERAASEIFDQIGQGEGSGHVLLCSSRFDADRLGPALLDRFGGTAIGCTSIGEIGPEGYTDGAIVGFSFGASYGHPQVFEIDLDPARMIGDIAAIATEVRGAVARTRAPFGERAFGILFIDGLSGAEELLVSRLQAALVDVAIVGGSASENLSFDRTMVFGPSGFHSGKAVLLVVHTIHPFHVFNSNHFAATGERMVITGAVPETRTVTEINGRPAAVEYARALGFARDELAVASSCHRPLMLRVLGNHYVRSIRQVNDDDSITFYCAIEEGLVITLGEPRDYIETLETALGAASRALPGTQMLFGVECVLRRMEVQRRDLVGAASRVMSQHHMLGFHSYGEQIHGLHVNQTLTGIAFDAS